MFNYISAVTYFALESRQVHLRRLSVDETLRCHAAVSCRVERVLGAFRTVTPQSSARPAYRGKTTVDLPVYCYECRAY